MKQTLDASEKPDCYPPSIYVIGPLITEVYPVKPKEPIEPHDFWLTTYDPANPSVRHDAYYARQPSDVELVLNATQLGDYSLQTALDSVNGGKPLFFLRRYLSTPSPEFIKAIMMMAEMSK